MDSTAQRIPIDGTYNFRDVGGYPAAGGSTRPGKLYRADALGRLGERGREGLRELGIRLVIDLRDDFEVEALPDDLEGLDVEVLRLPVFEGSGASASTPPSPTVSRATKFSMSKRFPPPPTARSAIVSRVDIEETSSTCSLRNHSMACSPRASSSRRAALKRASI